MSGRGERILAVAVAALPAGYLLAAGNVPVLSIFALAPLVWAVASREPLRWRGWWGWFLAGLFATALGLRLLDERSREPWILAGWFFAALASVQAACWNRGARRGVLAWNSLLAMAIGSAGPRGIQIPAAVLQLGLVVGLLPQSRAWVAWSRSRIARLAALLALAGTLALAAHQVQIRTAGRWGGEGRWGGAHRTLMGFSGVSRLGSFQSEYGNGGEEVALTLYADSVPRYLQGQVHAFYHQGSWIAQPRSRTLSNPRMVRDADVFCLDGRDPRGEPAGWMSVSASTWGLAPLPAGAACLAAVADSAEVNPGGAVTLRGASWSRGVWWFTDRFQDTSTTESDLKIPSDLERILDWAWAASASEGRDRSGLSPERRLASWFADRFRYSLVVPHRMGPDPLVSFLEDRRGYCEYFATASVLLLRRQGIPARYVTGYADPEPTARGISTFRRSHAHAWVSWRDSTGTWKIFDPTPPSDDPVAASRGGWMESLRARAVLAWHGVRDGNWRSVLDAPQRWMDSLVLRAKPSWSWLWALVPVILAVAFVWVRRRRKGSAVTESVWVRELARVEAALAAHGIRRQTGETVGSFLKRLPPEAGEENRAFLERYQRERFGRV